METSLPCTSPKSSRPTGRVWRVGLACVLYTTSYARMCVDFNRMHRFNTHVRLFASTDRIEVSSTLRLHTQVSPFAPNIAKSPSEQQAQRRMLAYDRLTRPVLRLFEKHWALQREREILQEKKKEGNILHVSARQHVRSPAVGSNGPASHHQFATVDPTVITIETI